MTTSRIDQIIGRSALAIITAIVAISNLATPVPAQSRQSASTAELFTNADCPSGYQILIDNQCMDYATGTIVLASKSLATGRRYTNANCPKGYDILLDNQCINFTTGYIELAREPVTTATSEAAK